jgi:sulfate adenylyltransferase subunit 2
MNLIDFYSNTVWDTELASKKLEEVGIAKTKRTAERRLQDMGFLPHPLSSEALRDEFGEPPAKLLLDWELQTARAQRKLVLFAEIAVLPNGLFCLFANDARNTRYWHPFKQNSRTSLSELPLTTALQALQHHIGKEIVVLPHGSLTEPCRKLPAIANIALVMSPYQPVLDLSGQTLSHRTAPSPGEHLSHLDRLEAESIQIMREVAAEADNPVMLYSIGKDSSVMLHLARKAFYPAPPPFPLLHVDTRWKFREMYLFRDHMAEVSGMDLLIHINPEAIEKDINPFDHGSALHTDITKTEGLKQALDKWKFDVAFGGARRDEEKSRAKERIFSFRTENHRWDPKNQRPELWDLYNCKKRKGESIRVFPLSNWTELDIWQYIYRENIPIVPLYFAKERPVVVRDGMILMVDDDRMRLMPGEKIERKNIRFRTLGCYPLSGAIESEAETLPQIILELMNARVSERQGRAIDSDQSASMEKKKQEGYF